MMAGDETGSSESVPSMTASQQQRHGAHGEVACAGCTRCTFHVKNRISRRSADARFAPSGMTVLGATERTFGIGLINSHSIMHDAPYESGCVRAV